MMDFVASLLRLLDDQAHGGFPPQRAGGSDDATNADVTRASLGKLDRFRLSKNHLLHLFCYIVTFTKLSTPIYIEQYTSSSFIKL